VFVQRLHKAGAEAGIEVTPASVQNATDIEAALGAAVARGNDAVITLPDSLPLFHRDLINDLVRRHRLAAIHPFRTFPVHGGLMSYGLDFPELYRAAARYVDQFSGALRPPTFPYKLRPSWSLFLTFVACGSWGLSRQRRFSPARTR